MSLEQRLKAVKRSFSEKAPDEAKEKMQRATKELQESGLAERAAGEGDRAPDFALPNTKGESVALSSLREKGPVVITFYRGRW